MRNALLAVALLIASPAYADEEASKVAQSVVGSYVNAYDKHDPKPYPCSSFLTKCSCLPTARR
jgi:hypothetical protein